MSDDRDYLGGLEEMVLLSIQLLSDDAYGASIHKALEEAGRKISIGSLYITLNRLERKGYVKSKLGDPTPERGGKMKKFFKLSGAGVKALQAAEDSRRLLRITKPFLGGAT